MLYYVYCLGLGEVEVSDKNTTSPNHNTQTNSTYPPGTYLNRRAFVPLGLAIVHTCMSYNDVEEEMGAIIELIEHEKDHTRISGEARRRKDEHPVS